MFRQRAQAGGYQEATDYHANHESPVESNSLLTKSMMWDQRHPRICSGCSKENDQLVVTRGLRTNDTCWNILLHSLQTFSQPRGPPKILLWTQWYDECRGDRRKKKDGTIDVHKGKLGIPLLSPVACIICGIPVSWLFKTTPPLKKQGVSMEAVWVWVCQRWVGGIDLYNILSLWIRLNQQRRK